MRALAALVLAISTSSAFADAGRDAYDFYVQGQCEAALAAFDTKGVAPQTAVERAIYGASLCCSPGMAARFAEATTLLNSAKGEMGAAADEWIEGKIAACSPEKAALPSSAGIRRQWLIISVQFSGKFGDICREKNLSPVAASPSGDIRDYHVVPDPLTREIEPPPEFLEIVRSQALEGADIQVCAPFVAASASQSVDAICAAAERFSTFMARTYGLGRPPVWTGLIHYDSQEDLADAMTRVGLPNCPSTFGYYDWRRNAVIFAAPASSFGTFNHEMTHVLLHWGAPLIPRWLEEGLAAAYENSIVVAGEYCSTENPWRSEALRTAGLSDRDPIDRLKEILHKSVSDFEGDPIAATIAREAIRAVQDNGDLSQLYTALVAASQDPASAMRSAEQWLLDAPSPELVDFWREALDEALSHPPPRCR
jgi:hypothetical protein